VPQDAGVYRVDVTLDAPDAQAVTRFVRAGTERKEYFHPTRNEALLQRLAEATGGRYLAPDQVGELEVLLNFASTGVRTVEVLPLWNLPVFFLLLVLLKLAEWSLRRAWGRI
jgi:hypothetical protein